VRPPLPIFYLFFFESKPPPIVVGGGGGDRSMFVRTHKKKRKKLEIRRLDLKTSLLMTILLKVVKHLKVNNRAHRCTSHMWSKIFATPLPFSQPIYVGSSPSPS